LLYAQHSDVDWMLHAYCRLEYEMRNRKKEEKELKMANANSNSQE